MERRDFLKGIVGGATLLLASRVASASEYEYHEYQKYHDKYHEYKTKVAPHGKIHRLQNPDKPTMMEKKHVPAIEAPKEVAAGEWFEVKVKVGYQVTHPSTAKHWITEIKLLCDRKKIAEVSYPVGGVAASEATFKIRLENSATLEALEHCNLHGTWMSEPVKINVKKA